MHSLFSSVKIYVNDFLVTTSGEHYPFKAYITNTITFSNLIKACQLSLGGYESDTGGSMNADSTNTGWSERILLFKEDGDLQKDYLKNGTTFISRLQHDLCTITTGIPPGVKIRIELEGLKMNL